MSKKNITKTVALIITAICSLILIGLIIFIAIPGEGETPTVAAFFQDLSSPETLPYIIGCVVIIILAAIFLLILNKKNSSITSKWTTKELIIGALCISLSFVLSYIKIFHMPQGGSITPASMLPIFLFAYIFGTKHGIVVAVAYGLLQMIQDAYIVHWAQALFDYILAFASLALAGLFKKSIIPGILVGGFGRFFFAFLSGFIFFAEYAPEGQSPVIYSLVYQITYIIPELVICCLISAIPTVSNTISLVRNQALQKK